MISYYKARAIYCRNMLFGIGLCMYLYIAQSGLVYLVVYDINDKLFSFWPILLVVLYGVFAWIRKKKGKERLYDGRLRIIPILFIGYMLLMSVLQMITAW